MLGNLRKTLLWPKLPDQKVNDCQCHRSRGEKKKIRLECPHIEALWQNWSVSLGINVIIITVCASRIGKKYDLPGLFGRKILEIRASKLLFMLSMRLMGMRFVDEEEAGGMKINAKKSPRASPILCHSPLGSLGESAM